MPARNIKVAIADDHNMFRKGMMSLLKDYKGMKVVIEAGNGKELLAALKYTPCDVVLMDIEMPEMDGIEATERALSRYPELKVLVMSQYDEQNLILHVVDKGAHGYLLKTADPEEVEQAIRNVMTNGYHNSEVLTKALFNKEKNKKQQKALKGKKVKLSVRELEVRSEEHTSELQSHSFISYAVFCLKKKINKKKKKHKKLQTKLNIVAPNHITYSFQLRVPPL